MWRGRGARPQRWSPQPVLGASNTRTCGFAERQGAPGKRHSPLGAMIECSLPQEGEGREEGGGGTRSPNERTLPVSRRGERGVLDDCMPDGVGMSAYVLAGSGRVARWGTSNISYSLNAEQRARNAWGRRGKAEWEGRDGLGRERTGHLVHVPQGGDGAADQIRDVEAVLRVPPHWQLRPVVVVYQVIQLLVVDLAVAGPAQPVPTPRGG